MGVELAPDGITELARSAGVSDTELVSLPAPSAQGGRYFLKVIGANEGVDSDYEITIEVP